MDRFQSPEEFIPWRVFINHIDSYHGKILAEYLLDERIALHGKGKYRPSAAEAAEHEEVEEEEEEEGEYEVDEAPKSYEVIGTLSAADPPPEKITRIIPNPQDRDSLLAELMKCGVVIYDITGDSAQLEEARWALEAIAKASNVRKAVKRRFILISNVMSWALTKSSDPNGSFNSLGLSESDYRKRRAHPNFIEHIRCERDVSMTSNEELSTFVICCGITYGYEEGTFHYLFKMCWENADFLPIFADGENRLPLLHVRDLVAVVAAIMRDWPSVHYIVAVEEDLPTQKSIVERISEAFGNGNSRNVPPEEAFLLPEINQSVYDSMTIDLNIKSDYLADLLGGSFLKNIEEIVREYKVARGLGAVRVIVLGPPASGKTRVARYLAQHYQLPYIDPKEQQEKREDEDDATLNGLIRKRLESRVCLNRGYVLDGYPETYVQAKDLFTEVDGDGPELVILLDASQEFLIERVVELPEREMQRRGYTEELFIRRLRDYRERYTCGDGATQFFDELQVRILVLPIEEDVCPDMIPTIRRCLEKLGKPRTYGERKEGEGEGEAEEEEMSAIEKEREAKAKKWIALSERLKEEEEERLCILSEPPRHYLAQYVLPTVTRALIRVSELRPEDPLDFLAEYLFEENPEGKMFEPDYCDAMSSLLELAEEFREDMEKESSKG